MEDLYLSGINYESFADGEGVRATFFFSGCKHNCKGCHSKDSHNFKYGTLITEEVIDKIQKELDKRPFLSGITLSGGDPMFSALKVVEFLNKLNLKGKTIWIYSGFTYHEICENEEMKTLLNMCDVLVDGQFNNDLRDVTLKFRGSSNQNIIDLKESRYPYSIMLWGK